MNFYDIFTQAIGWVGTLMFLISFQVKDTKRLLVFQVLASSCFTIQFAMLGAVSGCLSTILDVIKMLLLTKYDDWKWVRSYWVCALFCAVGVSINVIGWEGTISIFSLLASCSSTVGYWTNNPGVIRLVNMTVTSPSWIVYDVFAKSWAGIANETIAIISIIVSFVRYGFKELMSGEQN